MRKREIVGLAPGTRLVHRRYGLVTLCEVLYGLGGPDIFGIVIEPVLPFGRVLLEEDSGSDVPRYLEDSLRRLSLYTPHTPHKERAC